MDIGDWERAQRNYIDVISREQRTCESDFIMKGITQWFQGDVASAIESWRQSMDAPYADKAGSINGPLALWYASRQLADEKLRDFSERELKRYWRVRDYRSVTGWIDSLAIAGFVLRQVPAEVFLSDWKADICAMESRRLTRVHFWVGMVTFNQSAAAAHFREAFSRDRIGILEYEYFLAKGEYSRLTGENPWRDHAAT